MYKEVNQQLMDTHWIFHNLNLAPGPLIFRSNSLFKIYKRKCQSFLWDQGWSRRFRTEFKEWSQTTEKGHKTVLPFSIFFPEKEVVNQKEINILGILSPLTLTWENGDCGRQLVRETVINLFGKTEQDDLLSNNASKICLNYKLSCILLKKILVYQ